MTFKIVHGLILVINEYLWCNVAYSKNSHYSGKPNGHLPLISIDYIDMSYQKSLNDFEALTLLFTFVPNRWPKMLQTRGFHS